MAKKEQSNLESNKETLDIIAPKSLVLAEQGVKTGRDFANLMSALMSDVISGRITPNVGNAACNAGGKLLKVVEMQYKYGSTAGPNDRVLELTD